MGTWGTGVFDSDLAADVRGEFRDLIGDKLSADEATDRMLAAWNECVTDPEDGPEFWVALAAAQWECGHVVDRVITQAQAVITGGADLARWSDDLLPTRRRVLDRLSKRLAGSPPAPKRLPRRKLLTTELEVGDLLTLRSNGWWFAFVVTKISQDRGGRYPCLSQLDWVADERPTAETIAAVPFLYLPPETIANGGYHAGFLVFGLAKVTDRAGRYTVLARHTTRPGQERVRSGQAALQLHDFLDGDDPLRELCRVRYTRRCTRCGRMRGLPPDAPAEVIPGLPMPEFIRLSADGVCERCAGDG